MNSIELKGCLTTGIGSLPHHNVDAALEYSFQYDIPFLPQIPIRNPREFMIPGALDMLPGLESDGSGEVVLSLEGWKRESSRFGAGLDEALRGDSFEKYEPTPESSSCWRPFLWEAQEKKLPYIKVQIAGPITCQWVLQLSDGSRPENHPELGGQILKLITLKAFALIDRLKAMGTQPILFFDEPGIYAFYRGNPKHMLALQELRLLVTALKKRGALVGIHCCSNADWPLLLESGLNLLSCDTGLSLAKLLETPELIRKFLDEGRRFSLGIVPTNLAATRASGADLLQKLRESLDGAFGSDSLSINRVLQDSLLTPACGLALKSVGEAEAILAELKEIQKGARPLK